MVGAPTTTHLLNAGHPHPTNRCWGTGSVPRLGTGPERHDLPGSPAGQSTANTPSQHPGLINVSTNPLIVTTFEVDAHQIVSINHPAIVPLHDYWARAGAAYVVTHVPDPARRPATGYERASDDHRTRSGERWSRESAAHWSRPHHAASNTVGDARQRRRRRRRSRVHRELRGLSVETRAAT